MTPEEAYMKIDQVVDRLGAPIDTGIKKVVVGLWAHGIETSGSCEGHPDQGEPFPWVDIETSEPDGWKRSTAKKATWKKANEKQRVILQKLLDEFNDTATSPYPLALLPRGTYGAVRLQTGRTKSIADTLSPDFLKELQEQMNNFADFLLTKPQKTLKQMKNK